MKSSPVMSGIGEDVATFLRRVGLQDVADGIADGVSGRRRGLVEALFELGEELLDGVQLGRVVRQEEELGTGGADGPAGHIRAVPPAPLQLTPEVGAAWRCDIPSRSIARGTRSRRSIEKGLPILAGFLPQPDG